MLSVIDEAGVDRGTIGQCVHALVDTMEDTQAVMESIAADPRQNKRVRHSATLFAVTAAQSKSVDEALAVVDRIRETVRPNEEFVAVMSWLDEELRQAGFVSLY